MDKNHDLLTLFNLSHALDDPSMLVGNVDDMCIDDFSAVSVECLECDAYHRYYIPGVLDTGRPLVMHVENWPSYHVSTAQRIAKTLQSFVDGSNWVTYNKTPSNPPVGKSYDLTIGYDIVRKTYLIHVGYESVSVVMVGSADFDVDKVYTDLFYRQISTLRRVIAEYLTTSHAKNIVSDYRQTLPEFITWITNTLPDVWHDLIVSHRTAVF